MMMEQGATHSKADTMRVQLIEFRKPPGTKIKFADDVVNLVREMEDYDREYVKIIDLDTKNKVIGVENVSVGSIDASIVQPRELIKGAILKNSASVIMVHNHPSGDCHPSPTDIQTAERLRQAFTLVGISFLDSVIVGKNCGYSLKEHSDI